MANYIASDTDLTAIANAIRTKSGTSEQLIFPSGFVSTVEAIPTDDLLEKSIRGQIVDYTNENITSLPNYAFYYNDTAPQNLKLPNCTSIGTSAFRYSGSLRTFFGPKAAMTGQSPFFGAKNMTICVVCGFTGSIGTNADLFMRYGTPHLLNTVDMPQKKSGLPKRTFYQCDSLTTLILREAEIYPIGDVNAFYQTPFDSGGSGGTIYIPKALYDHLGDNSELDYKAATNWSVLDSYGTITWAQIEGSIYETQYAEGTPITT